MYEADPDETTERRAERGDRDERDGVRCARWRDAIEDGCGCVEVWERLSERRAER